VPLFVQRQIKTSVDPRVAFVPTVIPAGSRYRRWDHFRDKGKKLSPDALDIYFWYPSVLFTVRPFSMFDLTPGPNFCQRIVDSHRAYRMNGVTVYVGGSYQHGIDAVRCLMRGGVHIALQASDGGAGESLNSPKTRAFIRLVASAQPIP
jgi:hypothetical protein